MFSLHDHGMPFKSIMELARIVNMKCNIGEIKLSVLVLFCELKERMDQIAIDADRFDLLEKKSSRGYRRLKEKLRRCAHLLVKTNIYVIALRELVESSFNHLLCSLFRIAYAFKVINEFVLFVERTDWDVDIIEDDNDLLRECCDFDTIDEFIRKYRDYGIEK